MGGVFSCTNKSVRNAVTEPGETTQAPRASVAVAASPITNRRAAGSGPLPPALPKRQAPRNTRAQDAAGIVRTAAASVAARPANAPMPVSQARIAKRQEAIDATKIVTLQAEITFKNIDRELRTTSAQLQKEVNAWSAHPPYVAHVAALEVARAARARSTAARQAYAAVRAQGAALSASMHSRMIGASIAASAGHPEQLQQLTHETHAMQAAVAEAHQASQAAAQEALVSEAAVLASAAVGEEMAAAMQALQPRKQNLRELADRKQLAADALFAARNAHFVMQGEL